MELNQTAPPPTSPVLETDGDEQCRMEVTDMAIDGVMLLISLCGLLGNGAVLWLLNVHIRRNPITAYIRNLAVTSSTFLLLMVASSLLYMVENASCSTVVPRMYLKSLFLLSHLIYSWVLYILTAISIERCVSILCSSIRCIWLFFTMMRLLLLALSIAVIATVSSLCLFHEHEHCRMALISTYVLNFVIFVPTMVISCIITFIKLWCGSQQHQTKRLYMVIFLTVLFFLIFGLPLSIWTFLQQFGHPIVPYQVVFLLACINSSSSPFIYFLVGSCKRHCSFVSLQVTFRRVFEEPEDNPACSNAITMDTLAPAS